MPSDRCAVLVGLASYKGSVNNPDSKSYFIMPDESTELPCYAREVRVKPSHTDHKDLSVEGNGHGNMAPHSMCRSH